MVGPPVNLSESSSPGGQEEVEDTDQGPNAENQVKENLAVDQLSSAVEEALSIEEQVLMNLSDPMVYDLSGGVAEVGSGPAAIESSGSRTTPAEVPPSTAANSNIPSEVAVETSISDRVVWATGSRLARRRSLEPASRVKREVSGSLSKHQLVPGNSDPLFLDPLNGVGKPYYGPLPNPALARQRSCSPVSREWRTARREDVDSDEGGDMDDEEGGGEGRGGDDQRAEDVGGGGAQAAANNIGIMGPAQMYGNHGQRDLAAQQKQREKRARCRRNQNLRKAKEKSSADLTASLKGLNVQVVVGGSVVAELNRKRATTSTVNDTPVSKKSRLQDSKLAQSLAEYLGAEVNQLTITGPRTLQFFLHGPIAIPTLRQFARTLRDIHRDVGGIPFSHPSDVLRNIDGLVVLQLDSQDLSTVTQVDVQGADRSRTEASPQLSFFSSELLSLAAQIEQADGYECSKCLQSHWPVTRTKFVLVTESEVVAAAGFPTSLTMPDAPKYVVPPTAADECYDIVWVLGGLLSDPARILKAIYGSYQGNLVICLDLGALAISSGESSASVWDRLHDLVRCLKASLRHPQKGGLRLVVLPPMVHLGNNELVLHQHQTKATTKLALAELLDLRRSIDMFNGSVSEQANTPMKSWAMFASSRHESIATDAMGRTFREVAVREASSTWVGEKGNLHLQPAALHNMVRSVVAFMRTHAGVTW